MVLPSKRERSRAFAQSEASRLLGLDELTSEALFGLAAEALTPERARRCLELARLEPLTRRSTATSAVAALIVGVRSLGVDWWSQVHRQLGADRQWVDRMTPDQLLAGDAPDARSSLETLGYWVADDSADAIWGRPIDTVDLNDPAVDDRVVLPDGARPGERFVAAWDPGCRVDVLIVARDGPPDEHREQIGARRGSLGSQLGDLRYVTSADADWAWAIATDVAPIRLPGEVAGSPNDPFAVRLDPDAAQQLYRWALEHEPTVELLGPAWTTRADAWTARFSLGLPYDRPGNWMTFDRAIGCRRWRR
jgi:hypothetical protein